MITENTEWNGDVNHISCSQYKSENRFIKKRKLPKLQSVKIGPITYNVKYKNNLKIDDDDARGCIYHNKSEINICTGLSPEVEKQTILHEIVHGILANNNIYEVSDIKNFEDLVDIIASGVICLLKDNDKLNLI